RDGAAPRPRRGRPAPCRPARGPPRYGSGRRRPPGSSSTPRGRVYLNPDRPRTRASLPGVGARDRSRGLDADQVVHDVAGPARCYSGGMTLKGRTALGTGASSGIGVAFARQLARDGAALILTARRTDRLESLAGELREAHGIEVTTITLDLGKPDAPRALYEATEGAGKQVDILVNNAGFGTQERFDRIPWTKSAEQIQLNIVSLTEL